MSAGNSAAADTLRRQCVLVQGSYYAGRGLQRGFLSSTQSLGPRVLTFLGWVPELILGSAAIPSLQVCLPAICSCCVLQLYEHRAHG